MNFIFGKRLEKIFYKKSINLFFAKKDYKKFCIKNYRNFNIFYNFLSRKLFFLIINKEF